MDENRITLNARALADRFGELVGAAPARPWFAELGATGHRTGAILSTEKDQENADSGYYQGRRVIAESASANQTDLICELVNNLPTIILALHTLANSVELPSVNVVLPDIASHPLSPQEQEWVAHKESHALQSSRLDRLREDLYATRQQVGERNKGFDKTIAALASRVSVLELAEKKRSCLTLEAARNAIGASVIYMPENRPEERGTIVDVGTAFVFVRYPNQIEAKAARPDELRLDEEIPF